MRVHIVARELNVSSKVIVEKCQAEGIDSITNHMSTLSAGLEATVREWFSEGAHDTTVETAKRIDLKKARAKSRRKSTVKADAVDTDTDTDEGAVKAVDAVGETATVTAVSEVAAEGAEPSAPTAVAETPVAGADDVTVADVTATSGALSGTSEAVAEPPQVSVESPDVSVEAPATEAGDTKIETAAPNEAALEPVAEIAPSETDKDATEGAKPDPPKATVHPAGPVHVPTPAKLAGPRVVRYEPIESNSYSQRRSAPVRRRPPGPGAPGAPAPAGPGAPGGAGDRSGRRRGRGSVRKDAERVGQPGSDSRGWRDRDLLERQERLAGATGRRIHRRRSIQQAGSGGAAFAPTGPKTEATVHEPVQMKEFCSATGLSFIQLFKVLRDEHNMVGNINMTLAPETAELLALHFGIELTVVAAKTKLDELKEEFEQRPRKNLKPRAPVVTMLGHVDHGKTSLLDAIRRTRVAAREDGGITQHIGAHHIKTEFGAVTFLDTPGHAAFSAMRARGAQATDVVVLVVAADDGVMPQTVEAINHTKAADVSVVVALNKIDLGDQNKIKIFGQLTEHGLTPSGDWGGEIDVLETSASTGTGITEMLEHLSALSSVLELTADPTLPARGVVIEAETKPGVGAVVRVLVQDGTLRVGAFVVCGNAAGKVRALLDDRGERIREAGPSMPVEVWGLDDVPAAGDALYQVESLQRAKDIATETKHVRVERSRLQSRKVQTLEEMLRQRDSDEAPELNVIIKADVDGSVAALRQILGEIPSQEVRMTLRHTGVGAVNDSDVLLAAACRGIIVAFRVEASVGARRLAEQHGVDVRPYRVIYDVADDVKKALEGLLAPEERPESRGAAEVRQVFHLSKGKGVGKGVVAGSLVSNGVVERNHLAKIVRDGVVVREGCKFASLRRFKDDVKEVRAGMECGIRLEGFDDLHVGDVIETYEIVKIARTL